jgi:ribonuclease P protein component
MAAPRLPFARAQRLRQSREFAQVRQHGQRLVLGCLIANWRPSAPNQTSRLGVVTSGKIGNAVVRARARRLMRECFRLHQHEFAPPVELVLVARASIKGRDYAAVEKDFLAVTRKAGLLK